MSLRSGSFPRTFHASLQLLLTRRFGTFWLASLLSNIGTWAQQVAQPWLMLSLGASPWLLGLDTFALGGPGLLLTLLGGVLADRADRRRLIATLQSIQMLCPLLIVGLLLHGSIQPWIIVALSLVVGVTDALSMPSFQTIVSTLVDRRQLPTGIALNTTQFNLSRILGPSLAGVLMASIGAVGAFAVSAASYLPFIAVALWILPRAAVQAVAPAEGGGDGPLLAGARAVLAQPALRGAVLTVLAGSLLCSPLLTFCPVLVKTVFQADVAQFSLTVSAFGAGGLLGGLLLMAVDPARDRRPLASWAASGFAAVVLLSALNPWAWALPLLFVAGGLAMTMANASANAWLQSQAPAAIRGQTVSLFMLAMRGGTALGGLLTGLTVSAWGVREALALNGLLALLALAGVRRGWLAVPRPTLAG
ncbi:MFS transporter [Ideonella dechloratans]|uniref:MFS transporter n=1 Tax=Ideonella dechloratans TaxID=36863 RepID=UPI0035B28E27